MAVARNLLSDSAGVSDSGELLIAECSLLDLANQYGTPLFVYDEAHIRQRCREALKAFPDGAVYASKAFLCLFVARLVAGEGMDIDVATGGEMFVAMSAGVPAKKLVFHGNNKSYGELRTAVKAGVGKIVVDSFDELDRIDRIYSELKLTPKVMVRITPGVSAHTHEFLSTGQDDTKFGFSVKSGFAEEAIKRVHRSASMEFLGVHAHIGSQIFSLENLKLGVQKIAEFAKSISKDCEVQELCVGGGLGVAYVEGEEAPSISQWANAVKSVCKSAGIKARITAEPGRAIAASSALTLYTVGTIKDLELEDSGGSKTYVSVDGGMSDNPRPVLYGSGYETFLPRAVEAERTRKIVLVGKHCETGDTLVQDGRVPEDLMVGDILATPVTGAYGHSMGSNYNKVPRPAVVFVNEGKSRLVIRRESYSDLLSHDAEPRAVLEESLGFEGGDEDSQDFIA